MATPRAKPAKADLRTAQRTLDFLAQCLRTEQYRLNRCQRTRRKAERNEDHVRHAIRALSGRIQREIDAHPTLYTPQGRPSEGA